MLHSLDLGNMNCPNVDITGFAFVWIVSIYHHLTALLIRDLLAESTILHYLPRSYMLWSDLPNQKMSTGINKPTLSIAYAINTTTDTMVKL